MVVEAIYVLIALDLPATTYGYGEKMCGQEGKAIKCSKGAITATGDQFNPNAYAIAIPAPKKLKLKGNWISLQDFNGKCFRVKVNDKKDFRYVGKSGIDVTPAVQARLTGKRAVRHWSGKVNLCKEF